MKFRRFLRAGMAVIHARLSRSYRSPLGVYIMLSDRCNARCVYCNYDRVARHSPQVLTAPLVCAGLDQFARLGTIRLNLSGGEPLLFDGLGRIIRHARKLGMFVAVSSNGLAMPERIAEVAEANVVMLSFDGSPAVHDAQRGPGTHDRVRHAMELLQARGIRFFTTTVLTARNLDDIPYILEVARRHRTVANFTLLQTLVREDPASHFPTTAQIPGFFPADADLRRALQRLISLKQAGAPIGSTLSYLRLLYAWPDYGKLYSSRRGAARCLAGRLFCQWYPDGMLYACGQGIGLLPGVDACALGIAEAFRRLPVLPDCNSCFGACDAENNLIYNLSPQALYNWRHELFRFILN